MSSPLKKIRADRASYQDIWIIKPDTNFFSNINRSVDSRHGYHEIELYQTIQ